MAKQRFAVARAATGRARRRASTLASGLEPCVVQKKPLKRGLLGRRALTEGGARGRTCRVCVADEDSVYEWRGDGTKYINYTKYTKYTKYIKYTKYTKYIRK